MNLLENLNQSEKENFQKKAAVLSFVEYFNKVTQEPQLHLRNAAVYFMDAVEHFSKTGGVFCAFEDMRVFGHEEVQKNIIRVLSNFVQNKKIDKLLLLHGPNGSAKSTLLSALMQGAERYSHTQAGALYGFSWVFPLKNAKTSLGFSGDTFRDVPSFAHLPADQIECKIPCESKDHPFLLLPLSFRKTILDEFKRLGQRVQVPDLFYTGAISAKNKKIFDALETYYKGDVLSILKHVQVERFYLSKKYRVGLASVEPQMSLDGHIRQASIDQSFQALPHPLRHLSLFETGGALVDANRGLIEYNDLLKRPLEAWKYLLVATEHAQASLEGLNLFFDLLLVASSNELHLESFRQYPDWPSFKARFELVRVPYLLVFSKELQIYEHSIPKALHPKPIAPYALEVAALWAVLTRLKKPKQEPLAVFRLTPMEKAFLYNEEKIPKRLNTQEVKELRSLLKELQKEHKQEDYEGKQGASPREIQLVLLNAAQNANYDHLSPFAVLDEIKNLISQKDLYAFLKRETEEGYQDAEYLLQETRAYLYEKIEQDIQESSGLINTGAHLELFDKYIKHLSAWIKKEKLLNPLTGKYIEPDVGFMQEVEKAWLKPSENQENLRRDLINQIAAFQVENPEATLDYGKLFQPQLHLLKESYYQTQKETLKALMEQYLGFLESQKASKEVLAHCERIHTFFIKKHPPSAIRPVIAFWMRGV